PDPFAVAFPNPAPGWAPTDGSRNGLRELVGQAVERLGELRELHFVGEVDLELSRRKLHRPSRQSLSGHADPFGENGIDRRTHPSRPAASAGPPRCPLSFANGEPAPNDLARQTPPLVMVGNGKDGARVSL